MNRKLLAICGLTISAMFLMFANFYNYPRAYGDDSVNSRDYQVVIAREQNGGDGVYVLDNREGNIAVFTYDASARALRARAVRPVADAFR